MIDLLINMNPLTNVLDFGPVPNGVGVTPGSVGSSVGVATVLGIGASIAASIGSAVGQAIVTGYALSKGGGDSTPSGLHAGLMKGRISTGRLRAGRMKR